MTHKGRTVPSPTIDHAAQLRDRMGAAAAAAFNPGVKWETYAEVQREQYRAVGQAVLDAIKTRGQRRGDLSVASIYTPDGRPIVELTADTSPAQFSPAKAREIALMLLEAADAAESDALIAMFGRETLGLDMVDSARLIDRFRQLREKTRGRRTDTA